MKEKLFLGIIGNMGPDADIYFQQLLSKSCGAKKDQDHIQMIVMKNPAISDRTEAILNNGDNPVPEMIKSAKICQSVGANIIVMPCNTAHYFYDQIQAQIRTPILHLIDNLAVQITKDSKGIKNKQIGLLATNGTLKSEVYKTIFDKHNINLATLSEKDNENFVHSSIYGPLNDNGSRNSSLGIKGGNLDESFARLQKAIDIFVKDGINDIILGCTELPLLNSKLKEKYPQINFIDPMEYLALELVRIHKEGIDKNKYSWAERTSENNVETTKLSPRL